jgi:UPF0716 protein FxsA
MRRKWALAPVALLILTSAEIIVFVLVGRWIGFGWAVLLILALSAAGLVGLRREGTRAWRGLRAAVGRGQPPGERVTDGLVGLAGALLLAMPGFLSGTLGLLVLVPPMRRLTRNGVRRGVERRLSSAAAGDLFGPRLVKVRVGQPQRPHHGDPGSTPTPSGPAIEGEVVDPRQP